MSSVVSHKNFVLLEWLFPPLYELYKNELSDWT